MHECQLPRRSRREIMAHGRGAPTDRTEEPSSLIRMSRGSWRLRLLGGQPRVSPSSERASPGMSTHSSIYILLHPSPVHPKIGSRTDGRVLESNKVWLRCHDHR